MRPGDRLVCAFVGMDTPGGYTFKAWPLHITLVPWFRLDVSPAYLSKQLAGNFIGSRVFMVNTKEEVRLGYKKRKTANLVEAPELMKLEGQTRRFLHTNKAWVVDEADKTRRRHFMPHVTVQGNARLEAGDSFMVDRIYIVEQKGNYKEVVGEVPLSNG